MYTDKAIHILQRKHTDKRAHRQTPHTMRKTHNTNKHLHTITNSNY